MNPLSKLVGLPHAEKAHLGALHTPAEIERQASLWPDTLARVIARKPEIQAFVKAAGFGDATPQRPFVYLIGAGTSDYVGRCVVPLLRKQWDCNVEAVASTSLISSYTDSLVPEQPRLWISVSRSGNSPEGVAILERALTRNPEIAHIVITCSEAGEMAQLAKGRHNCLALVLGPDTNDKGLAMTASFTNMVVCGQALAHVWNLDAFAPTLEAMCETARIFLPPAAESAHAFAQRGLKRACFLGTGPLAGVAAESALKLLELTAGRLKTMSETTLGLRHGPMSAIDRDTLVVQFISTDPVRRSYELDLLKEIQAKELTGSIVAVSGMPESGTGGLDSLHWLTLGIGSPVEDVYRPPLDVFFGQCLGLFHSLQFGLSPDAPSPNGAISRVVPAFTIH